ncbi:hypothetical protein HanXRQr2_Chr04g0190881 [Helianthus annuus]|uniref:Uncharacterized protein n=1 Tax=Helianthus annuus TaxID=4232 RepID=A0A9K3NT93_HELAN|nr:uncharacterized protein LOC110938182 isoform X2 [Helianthus annuus]KAF5812287.1 hypothetical protein HanXRQr2_Chr04g0190881 [Helianthus annuus]KAJ0582848.1 hypothetical protein HanHA300_Chr04g0156581 [Helianthus annuus]KAJ0591206.1 hypothetical protein HanIR_Chr04g0205801 [Helianthus annuus]KAJ0598836.1 hypothetical protein HanHA89_Chr04g0170071 [Helianthus annuus]KAJ0933402.1 hypothetical protein HanPSC8_Chr04g0184391 [Helianthus annuus]
MYMCVRGGRTGLNVRKRTPTTPTGCGNGVQVRPFEVIACVVFWMIGALNTVTMAMLSDDFFTHLKFELGELQFAVQKTEDMEDRVIDFEALQKVLLEGIGAYDKLQANIVKAKDKPKHII